MKELETYLSEAVIRGGYKHRSEFPKHPDIEEIANFLEYNGFEEYDGPHTLNVYSNYYSNGDAYAIGFRGKQLSIYRYRDNAMFYIWLGNPDKYYADFGEFTSGSSRPSYVNQVIYNTYEEFREAVMDHYGW